MTTIMAIHRAIPLVHASPGCGFNLTLGQVLASGYQGQGYCGGGGLPSTRFTTKQVVYGGEDRLRQQLKATLDWMDGDFIAILTGCTADLIGDDIEAVAKEFNTREMPVVCLKTGGFRGNSFRGYEIVLESLANQVMKKSSRREKGLVNIFGIAPYQDIFWRGDLKETQRVLEKLGLKANLMYRHEFGLDAWRKAPEAELNLILSPWVGLDFAKKFEEELEVPYLVFPELPVGPSETSKLLRMVGERLNVSNDLVEKVVAEEEGEAYYYLEGMADPLYADLGWQLSFAVIGDSNLVIGVTKFLTNDIGYIPDLAVITDDPPDKYRETIINELTNLNHDLKPKVVFESNSDKVWEAAEKTDADVLLGSSLDYPVAHQLTAAHVCIGRPAVDRQITNDTLCGYRGGLELLADIVTAAFKST